MIAITINNFRGRDLLALSFYLHLKEVEAGLEDQCTPKRSFEVVFVHDPLFSENSRIEPSSLSSAGYLWFRVFSQLPLTCRIRLDALVTAIEDWSSGLLIHREAAGRIFFVLTATDCKAERFPEFTGLA